MKEEKVISALIGLVGACNNKPKTANTDDIVIKALAFPAICQEMDEEGLSGIVDEIYAEKNVVAPDCAHCAFPCGNTSDYDMDRLYGAEPEIREIKLQILSKCENLAARIYQSNGTEKNEQMDCEIFYKTLSYISFDIGKTTLLELLKEIEERLSQI